MRVLISTRQGAGHFGPLIPFAHALLRNNDDVVVTAPASVGPMIAGAGLDHHPIPDPPAEEREPIFAKAKTLDPDAANALVGADLFVRIDTRAGYPHMVAAIERLEPDVMLYDISDFAAGLAAETTGLPVVSVSISQGIHMQRLVEPLAEALNEVRAEIGLDPDPQLERLAETPSFSLIPQALETPETEGADRILRFRVPEPPPRPLPDWWPSNDWPLVYVTFGTVVPTIGHYPQLYRDAIDALSVLPVRILVTVGRDCDPAELGPTPPNVHAARWIPQADVLPHAAAIVSHGGSGTVTGSLAAGVPAVVVPFIADQFHNAQRVAELGAGIALDPGDMVRLPDAVRTLLADRSYRDAASKVAAEMQALPTVDTATALLRAYSQPRSVA
jgi:UDP:flavonoid glycosyltransferase YjiC (YdhE family)